MECELHHSQAADEDYNHFYSDFEGEGEDEDDEELYGDEAIKERCSNPKCKSPCLYSHTTEGGQQVIRCQSCESLLCKKCRGLLKENRASDKSKQYYCLKCGIA